ncbi:Class I-like SAM-dependent O-methyltransferase [Dillenia turbinata]|uniref:Class I-like SAM-dependent O-methyltransferase n=1 Tax=Dillenia turbinata TaxID=194707 RepID=A0AAN8WE14_9MAGN
MCMRVQVQIIPEDGNNLKGQQPLSLVQNNMANILMKSPYVNFNMEKTAYCNALEAYKSEKGELRLESSPVTLFSSLLSASLKMASLVFNPIDFLESLALPALDKLSVDPASEVSFDFAFVDADKDNYKN